MQQVVTAMAWIAAVVCVQSLAWELSHTERAKKKRRSIIMPLIWQDPQPRDPGSPISYCLSTEDFSVQQHWTTDGPCATTLFSLVSELRSDDRHTVCCHKYLCCEQATNACFYPLWHLRIRNSIMYLSYVQSMLPAAIKMVHYSLSFDLPNSPEW